MKWRVGGLILLLMLRLLPGWIWIVGIQKGKKVRVVENMIRVEQKGSNCIMRAGRFWVKTQGWCKFSRKDNVEIIGRTRFNLIDVFLGRIWLDDPNIMISFKNRENQIRKVSGKLTVWQNVREKLALNYMRLLPEPEVGLVAGIVLGEKSKLGDSFYKDLIKTGTIHVVVASGYNVMVVGGMIMSGLLYFMRRKWATVGAVAAMVIYGLLAGGDPPVARAVIMGSLVFLGQAIGRPSKAIWSLFLAGMVMLIVESSLIESISFQLSVMASLGLFWLEPKMRVWLEEKEEFAWSMSGLAKVAGAIMKTELLPTLAAQVMTMPVIWWHFGRVSWISPLVNVIILPLVPVIMIWGGVMLFLSLIWSPLGVVVGWLVYSLTHLIVVVVRLFG